MEEHYKTMRGMLMLTDTGIEALEHLAKKTDGNAEDMPIYLFADFFEAFMTLCRSYDRVGPQLRKNKKNEIEKLAGEVLSEMMVFSKACQENNLLAMKKNLVWCFIPAVKAYRQELAVCVNPYILC